MGESSTFQGVSRVKASNRRRRAHGAARDAGAHSTGSLGAKAHGGGHLRGVRYGQSFRGEKARPGGAKWDRLSG